MGASSSDTYAVSIGFGLMGVALAFGVYYCYKKIKQSRGSGGGGGMNYPETNNGYAQVATRQQPRGGNNREFEMWSSM